MGCVILGQPATKFEKKAHLLTLSEGLNGLSDVYQTFTEGRTQHEGSTPARKTMQPGKCRITKRNRQDFQEKCPEEQRPFRARKPPPTHSKTPSGKNRNLFERLATLANTWS
ncbi:hypothetical protein KCP77_15075 [Salmonella enterica subsp. enterica]|nr:hypothetical protein KCP77_15075 [Salmonella enterica subsp. enterica]